MGMCPGTIRGGAAACQALRRHTRYSHAAAPSPPRQSWPGICSPVDRCGSPPGITDPISLIHCWAGPADAGMRRRARAGRRRIGSGPPQVGAGFRTRAGSSRCRSPRSVTQRCRFRGSMAGSYWPCSVSAFPMSIAPLCCSVIISSHMVWKSTVGASSSAVVAMDPARFPNYPANPQPVDEFTNLKGGSVC